MKIINTTPHPITMQSKDGEVYTVEPYGLLLNAEPREVSAGIDRFGNELITTEFIPTPEGRQLLKKLKNEDSIIVGSIIAAQAYPGIVYALIPVPGYERVPIAQKRMCDWRFTIF